MSKGAIPLHRLTHYPTPSLRQAGVDRAYLPRLTLAGGAPAGLVKLKKQAIVIIQQQLKGSRSPGCYDLNSLATAIRSATAIAPKSHAAAPRTAANLVRPAKPAARAKQPNATAESSAAIKNCSCASADMALCVDRALLGLLEAAGAKGLTCPQLFSTRSLIICRAAARSIELPNSVKSNRPSK